MDSYWIFYRISTMDFLLQPQFPTVAHISGSGNGRAKQKCSRRFLRTRGWVGWVKLTLCEFPESAWENGPFTSIYCRWFTHSKWIRSWAAAQWPAGDGDSNWKWFSQGIPQGLTHHRVSSNVELYYTWANMLTSQKAFWPFRASIKYVRRQSNKICLGQV